LLEDVTSSLDGFLGRFDPAAAVAALDGAHGALVAEVRRPPAGAGPFGTIVMALVEGLGLEVRPEALAEVRGWITGAVEPGAVVLDRLAGAAATLDGLASSVAALDLRGVVGRLDAHHARLEAALHVHAGTSLLRVRLDGEVATTAPGALLGPVLVNRDRYLAEVTAAAAALATLAAASRSELDEAARALRDAATPLVDVVVRVQQLLHATTGVTVEGRPLREALAELLERVRPSVVLGPLADSLAGARDRTRDALVSAVITPLADALDDVRGVIEAFDIGFVRVELTAARDDVVATVEALRPSALLGPVLAEVEALRDRVAGFDPLGPVRAVVDGLVAVIDTFERDFAPTTLAAPALDTYDAVRDAVAAVDVDDVLRPVLDALDGVALQLEDGMTRLIEALGRVQDACASGGPSLGAALDAAAGLVGAAGSLDVNVSLSGGFG
jgi:hypothetical protein